MHVLFLYIFRYIYIYVLLISFYAILCHFYFSFIPYLIIFEFRRNFSLKKKKKKNCIKREWNVLTWGIFLTEPLDEIKALIALGRAAKIKWQLRGIGQRNISLILFLLLFFFSFPLSPFILSLSSHYFSSFPSFFR